MKKIMSLIVVIIGILFSMSITVCADIQISDINSGWYWPTSSSIRTITSEFGRARPTTDYPNKVHQAIDIAGSENSTVYATRTGDVVETFSSCKGSHNNGSCSCSGGSYYGNYVVIYHGMWNGHRIYSMYMHLKSVSVNVGTSVKDKQEIGKIGNTGPSDGAHLHFQISKGSKNPSHNSMTQAESNFINTNPNEVMFINEIFSHNRIGTNAYPNSKYGDIIYIMDDVNVTPPDTEAPTISDLKVTNVSGESFTIECNLNDNVGVTRVWLNISGPSGSKQQFVTISNNQFSYNVYTKDYGGAGLYNIQISAFDEIGNESTVSSLIEKFISADIGTDFYAKIKCAATNKFLINASGKCVATSENCMNNQMWKFIRQTDGSYLIVSVVDNKVLEKYSGLNENATPVGVYSSEWGASYQYWYLIPFNNGYKILSKNLPSTNKVIDAYNSQSGDNANVYIYDSYNTNTQCFLIEKFLYPNYNQSNVGKEFYAKIRCDATDKVLINDLGKCVATNMNGNPNQLWKFTCLWDDSYLITSAVDDKALEKYAGLNENATPVGVYSSEWGASYQYWYLIPFNNGYKILSKNLPSTNKVIDAYNSQSEDNANVYIYDSYNTNTQCFTIEQDLYSISYYSFDKQIIKESHVKNKNSCLSNIVPENTGYNFLGWSTSPTASSASYKPGQNYIGNKDVSLYAIWEQSGTYSESIVLKNGNNYNVKTNLYNLPDSCSIIIAGYKNKRLVDVIQTTQAVSTNLNGDIDEIKVMVWDSISMLMPLCDTEVIQSSEFIIE